MEARALQLAIRRRQIAVNYWLGLKGNSVNHPVWVDGVVSGRSFRDLRKGRVKHGVGKTR